MRGDFSDFFRVVLLVCKMASRDQISGKRRRNLNGRCLDRPLSRNAPFRGIATEFWKFRQDLSGTVFLCLEWGDRNPLVLPPK